MLLDGDGSFWMVMDIVVGCCWVVLDGHWMVLDVVGWCWTLLDGVGHCWMVLEPTTSNGIGPPVDGLLSLSVAICIRFLPVPI